uniref:CRIB domain-containing protein n=1 Tax=Poecilia reticulata TaxID=8081 RepID=A0A3P9Q960_POERE
MPLKTSLYRNPSSSRWSSRNSKRRDVLSVEMISLPLGDFRHVSHIGSDGQDDSFGDLSFLKTGHGLLRQSSKSEQNLFLSCKPPPKPPRLNLDGTEGMQSPEWSVDQKRKKCNSLPLLDSEEEDKCENEEVDETRNDFASNQTCRSLFSLDLDKLIREQCSPDHRQTVQLCEILTSLLLWKTQHCFINKNT